MERAPYKFEIGQKVLIGETKWSVPEMKARNGQVDTIIEKGFFEGFGNGNHYKLEGGFYFEEECLSLFEEPIELKEVTNEEVLDILESQ